MVFLYLQPQRIIWVDSLKLKSINELEDSIIKLLSESEVSSIKDKILRGRTGSKNSLIIGLKNLSRTRNSVDLIHEVNQLVVTANRVIENSIESSDVEGVLLGHQLKSDGSIYFKNSFVAPENGVIEQKYDLGNEKSSRFNDYLKYIESSLFEQDAVQFLWVGFLREKLYCITLEDGEFSVFGYIESTEKKEILNWIADRLPTMAFDDTPDNKDIFVTREDLWEAERVSIFEGLPCIDIPPSSKDAVIFSDVEFLSFPHNLIKSHGEIIALTRGIFSPLSFDNYVKYNVQKVCTKKIYAWAPVVEEDMAILIAFSRLKEKMNTESMIYDEGLFPTPSRDINIFISHGGRNGSHGFCGLYPAKGKAYDIDALFGIGKLAILFVCHAGSIVENVYSNSTHTLVKKLLENGYEAVISPSWSLNVCIPGIWTKEFLESFASGQNASKAVHRANALVDTIYRSPSASCAMHLFGNGKLVSA